MSRVRIAGTFTKRTPEPEPVRPVRQVIPFEPVTECPDSPIAQFHNTVGRALWEKAQQESMKSAPLPSQFGMMVDPRRPWTPKPGRGTI